MHNPVHRSEVVQVAGVVHLLVQLHIEGHLADFLVAPVNVAKVWPETSHKIFFQNNMKLPVLLK